MAQTPLHNFKPEKKDKTNKKKRRQLWTGGVITHE